MLLRSGGLSVLQRGTTRLGSAQNNGIWLARVVAPTRTTVFSPQHSFPTISTATRVLSQQAGRKSSAIGSLGQGGRMVGLSSSLLRHQQKQILHLQLGAMSYFSSNRGGRMPKGGNRLANLGGGAVVGLGILMSKGKYLLGVLKLGKLSTLVSMLVSVGAYSVFFGVPYAIGVTGLVLVHEAGHALVMNQLGIKFSPMVFLPFMGASITMQNQPRDAWEEALVAFGGPVLGSLGAGGVAIAAHTYDSQLMYALADFGFMINLFNMIPLGSLDGGRIAGACSPYAGVVGLGIGGTMAMQGMINNPIFYIVLLTGGWSTFQRFYDPNGNMPPGYYKITPTQRNALVAGYFGLIAAIFAAMDANARFKKSPEQLQVERARELSFDERHF